jgi:hypothetical protein
MPHDRRTGTPVIRASGSGVPGCERAHVSAVGQRRSRSGPTLAGDSSNDLFPHPLGVAVRPRPGGFHRWSCSSVGTLNGGVVAVTAIMTTMPLTRARELLGEVQQCIGQIIGETRDRVNVLLDEVSEVSSGSEIGRDAAADRPRSNGSGRLPVRRAGGAGRGRDAHDRPAADRARAAQGVVIDDIAPLRLDDLPQHPMSVGSRIITRTRVTTTDPESRTGSAGIPDDMGVQ